MFKETVFVALLMLGGMIQISCQKNEPSPEPKTRVDTVNNTDSQPAGPVASEKVDGKDQAWQRYTSAAGGYSVQFPQKPYEKQIKIPNAAVETYLNIMAVELPGGTVAYMTMYSDYPESLAKQADPKKVLEAARDGAAQNINGVVRSEKQISIAGHPGMALEIESPAGLMLTAHLYLVSNRLYQVISSQTKAMAKVSMEETKKFLQSFELSKEQSVKVATPPIAWQKYTSKAGKFSAMFPGEPKTEVKPVEVLGNKLTLNAVGVETGNSAFMIAFADYPPKLVNGKPVKQLLDGVRDRVVQQLEGKLIEEQDDKFGAFKGRRFSFESKDGSSLVNARIVMKGKRLYQLMVVMPKNDGSKGDADKFLGSLKLI